MNCLVRIGFKAPKFLLRDATQSAVFCGMSFVRLSATLMDYDHIGWNS